MTILFAFYLVIAFVAHGALGTADVRRAGLLYGSLTGATMITLRRASRHTPILFGPALIAGTFTALLLPLG